MKKLSAANAFKMAVIQREFLESVDELDFDTLPAATPELVKMLQRYDRLFGLRPSSNWSCGVDVRLIFVARKRFQQLDAKEQRRWMDERREGVILQPAPAPGNCSTASAN